VYGEFPIDNAFNAPHGIERLQQEILAIVSQPQFYVYDLLNILPS
jgi:hypothetical protein